MDGIPWAWAEKHRIEKHFERLSVVCKYANKKQMKVKCDRKTERNKIEAKRPPPHLLGKSLLSVCFWLTPRLCARGRNPENMQELVSFCLHWPFAVSSLLQSESGVLQEAANGCPNQFTPRSAEQCLHTSHWTPFNYCYSFDTFIESTVCQALFSVVRTRHAFASWHSSSQKTEKQ